MMPLRSMRGVRSGTAIVVLFVIMVIPARAVIPPGFEVIEISSGPEFHQTANMNNCGEIVYHVGLNWEDETEVFLYDNGKITQLTDNNYSDAHPDINDEGVIVWHRYWNEFETHPGEVVMLRNGEVIVLGLGNTPSINNVGHITWNLFDFESSIGQADIFFYDGKIVQQITNNKDRSNQSVRLNDHDAMVWTRYDFSTWPFWTSEIMLYNEGVMKPLPVTANYAQAPHINNKEQVIWNGWSDGQRLVELWSEGIVTSLIEDGSGAGINNHGELFFIRFHDGEYYGVWQTWLYRPGPPAQVYRLVDAPAWHSGGDINNDGECVWTYALNPPQGNLSGGILYLRRIRNGDVDFDNDVDEGDFAALPDCLTGPVETDRLCACRFYDLDHDRDVDLADAASFFNRFGSTDVLRDCCRSRPEPGCGDPAIENCVCELFSYCCTQQWDELCVSLADDYCSPCP